MPVSTSDIDITESYPTIRPSLNLNFARSRALDSRVSFTRGSSATYVGRDGLIKTTGEDEPRFDHDPVTLESLGLLLEESRTNQFGSHNFSSGWATNNCSLVTGISDPEGGTNARKLVVGGATNGTTACFITDNTSLTNGTTYTQSLWAKANVAGNFYSVVQIAPSTGFTQAYRNFNLSNGTLGSGDIPESDCKIEQYPDGWYRVSVTRTATSTISGRMAIAIVDSPTSGRLASISTGSANNDGIYIWGAQLEVSSFPTSLIKTTGSSATRAADFGFITGDSFSSWFNQIEGTLDVGYRLGYDNVGMRICQISNQSPSNVIDLVVGSGGGVGGYWFINTGNVTQFSSSGVTNSAQVGADRNFRSVLAYKENDCAAQQNKVSTITTDLSVTLATDYNRLLFYQLANGGDHIQGHLKYIRYYSKRLTDAQVTLLSQEEF